MTGSAGCGWAAPAGRQASGPTGSSPALGAATFDRWMGKQTAEEQMGPRLTTLEHVTVAVKPPQTPANTKPKTP